MPAPSPTTQRLISCLERFRGDEDGALGTGDWAGLADIFDRECAVIAQLALQADRHDPKVVARVREVQQRHHQLARSLDAQRAGIQTELSSLRQSSNRTQAVRSTYGQSPRAPSTATRG